VTALANSPSILTGFTCAIESWLVQLSLKRQFSCRQNELKRLRARSVLAPVLFAKLRTESDNFVYANVSNDRVWQHAQRY